MHFIKLYSDAKYLVKVGDMVIIDKSPAPRKVTYKSECDSDGRFKFEVGNAIYDRMSSDRIVAFLPIEIWEEINKLKTELSNVKK